MSVNPIDVIIFVVVITTIKTASKHISYIQKIVSGKIHKLFLL